MYTCILSCRFGILTMHYLRNVCMCNVCVDNDNIMYHDRPSSSALVLSSLLSYSEREILVIAKSVIRVT